MGLLMGKFTHFFLIICPRLDHCEVLLSVFLFPYIEISQYLKLKLDPSNIVWWTSSRIWDEFMDRFGCFIEADDIVYFK